MKIMISAEGPELTARVGHRFGASPYFIIVDAQTMAFEAVSNPAADNQSGGAGVTAKECCLFCHVPGHSKRKVRV